MSFDPNKPVTTRDGHHKITILKTDLKDRQPIVAVVENPKGEESVETFNRDGCFFPDGRKSHLDLVNPKIKRTVYINLYAAGRKTPTVTCYPTKQHADMAASDDRTACVPITFEE